MKRYRWTILLVGSFAQAMLGALIAAVPALSPALEDTYHLSLQQVGITLASVQGGSTLTLLAWGLLADRVGERPVLAAGLTGAGVALGLAAYAPSSLTLIIALFGAGMCGATVHSASGRAVMGWFHSSQRGLALGIRQTSAMLGAALSAGSLPAIEAGAGVGAALLALGGAHLAAAIAAVVWMREAPTPLEPVRSERPPTPFRDVRIWRIGVASGLLVFAQMALTGFVVLFLHRERGLSPGAAAGALSAMTLCGAVLRVALGYWSDRLRRRVAPLRWMTLGFAGALALAVAAMDAPTVVLVPALVAAGTFSVGWNGLAYTAVAEIAGRERSGAALGLHQTMLGFAGATTPIAFAAAVSATSWQAAFGLILLCPIAGYAVIGRKLTRGELSEVESTDWTPAGKAAESHPHPGG